MKRGKPAVEAINHIFDELEATNLVAAKKKPPAKLSKKPPARIERRPGGCCGGGFIR